jgi:AraC-like DNA-binding protein
MMSRVVPLIRAAAVFPLIRWMLANGRPVEARLAAAGLAHLRVDQPFEPVPLNACVALFDMLAQDDMPDAGCRAVTTESILEIAIISRVGLGAASPRHALLRISASMPYHCTHEHLTLETLSDAVVLRDRITVPMEPATRHLVQQYVAMMALRICAMAGAPEPQLRKVALMPHPDHGVGHLVPWLGPGVTAQTSDTLEVTMAAAVADRPFPKPGRTRLPRDDAPVAPLRGDGTLAASLRLILPSLFDEAAPSLDRVAAVAGMSRRTLQRHLTEERTSLSVLIEETRRNEALRRLQMTGEPLGALSSALGYSQQSALTRAVRRWTGQAPSRLRTGAAD